MTAPDPRAPEAARPPDAARRLPRVVAVGWRLCLVALTVLPLCGAAAVLIAAGVPDAVLDGDAALIELCVRAACDGEQLLGSYSRFGFNHPGPALFYAFAPFYAAAGGTTLSLCLGALAVQALALIGVLWIAWRRADGWTFAVLALALSLFTGFLGPIPVTYWGPAVTILVFVLVVTAWAAVAEGALWWLWVAVLASSFVVQVHLSYAPSVAALAAVALLLLAAPPLRRRLGLAALVDVRGTAPSRRAARTAVAVAIAVAIAVGVGSVALPLYQQLTTSPGNVTAIFGAFGEHGSDRSLAAALAVAAEALTRPVRAVFGAASFAPSGAGTQDAGAGAHAVVLAVQLALLAAATAVSARGGRRLCTALGVSCLCLHVAVVLSIRRIIGPVHPHLVHWMTGVGVSSWVVVVATLPPAVLARIGTASERARRAARAAALAAVTVGAAASSDHNTRQLLAATLKFVEFRESGASVTPGLDRIAGATTAFLRERSVAACALVVPGSFDLWVCETGLVLQLQKAGVHAVPPPDHRYMFPHAWRTGVATRGTLALCDPASRDATAARAGAEPVVELGGVSVFWIPD